eukprot:TRINITY_DN78142_c0_g1_i1.p1 TRINITY_DN78142_c0_g1~~TRINITY_DN78142_c0_g1_i1.p1  ORF type:complete len:708 (+),score=98.94 TRINITY_DN78142_c0_g1_i1:38-2125(+)
MVMEAAEEPSPRCRPRQSRPQESCAPTAWGTSSSSTSAAACAERHAPTLRREDFEFGTLLGEGAFARVLRARNVRTGGEYAVKMIDKKMIQVQDRTNGVMTERRMLLSFDHPGIVRLHFAFQDDWSLYFGLELVLGGELAKQIERMGICSRDFACFYAAEIVSILVYLRIRRVAHRDLKPENLLLTTEGHLKLVDFDAAVYVPDEGEGDAAGGCSKGQMQQQSTSPSFAGTALYLAPEVILGSAQPHQAFALDLWALGCIVYLMLMGKTPFHAQSEYLVFQRIQRGDFSFPACFQFEEAQRLIEALLSADPTRRPGAGPEGLVELQRHAFFGGSAASYCELRRQRPPPRVTRPHRRNQERGVDGHSLSPERSLPFDFTSSAECTPEVGQCFLSRRSTQVVTLASSTAEPEPPPSLDTSSIGCTHSTPPSTPLDLRHNAEANSPHFMMSIESRRPRTTWISNPSRGRSPSPRTWCSKAGQGQGPSAAPWRQRDGKTSLLSQAEDLDERQSAPPSNAASFGGGAVAVSDADAKQGKPSRPRPMLGLIDRTARWQWLEELSHRRILLRGEDIAICGRVVQRRFPCLRPKVLILTDLPRLLVMDNNARRVLHDLHLPPGGLTDGPGNTTGAAASPRESLQEPALQVKSRTDFVLRFGGIRLRCQDHDLGSEAWLEKIRAAQQFLLRQQHTSQAERAAAV